jgi:hypothetical protein
LARKPRAKLKTDQVWLLWQVITGQQSFCHHIVLSTSKLKQKKIGVCLHDEMISLSATIKMTSFHHFYEKIRIVKALGSQYICFLGKKIQWA